MKNVSENFFRESENMFLISKNFFERRRLLARLKALLITAACGDVVELVKSVCVQLSLIWSAGHPLHQAVSHFSVLFFFFEKTRGRHKEKEAEEQKRKNKTKQKQEKKDICKKDGKGLFFFWIKNKLRRIFKRISLSSLISTKDV